MVHPIKPSEEIAKKLEVCPSGVTPDPVKCGMGQEADCCIYLLMDPTKLTWVCGRSGYFAKLLEHRNAHGEMNAKRQPVLPYPQCQTERK